MDERQYDEYLAAMQAIDESEYEEEQKRRQQERADATWWYQVKLGATARTRLERKLPGYVKL
jgi:hypothetical protein